MDAVFKITQRIAYRNFQERERGGQIGRTENERKGMEKHDWFMAEKEIGFITKEEIYHD